MASSAANTSRGPEPGANTTVANCVCAGGARTQAPAEQQRRDAEQSKPQQVPGQRIRAVDADTVDAEQPMREQGVDHVPEAETGQHRAGQRPAPVTGATPVEAPQADQTTKRDPVHQRMEPAIPQHLQAQVVDSRHEAEQVVPLQDLVQQDAVEEAAQREAEHGAPAGPGGLPHRSLPEVEVRPSIAGPGRIRRCAGSRPRPRRWPPVRPPGRPPPSPRWRRRGSRRRPSSECPWPGSRRRARTGTG